MTLGDWIKGVPTFLFPQSVRHIATRVFSLLGLAYALFFHITSALPPNLRLLKAESQ